MIYPVVWGFTQFTYLQRAEALEEAVRVAAEPWARTKDDVAMNDHLKYVVVVVYWYCFYCYYGRKGVTVPSKVCLYF